uniref:tumor necrosis factor-like n=1 Tax=Semicossyphus pulcher TaxID=241346 RepID=UPI0037E8F3AA
MEAECKVQLEETDCSKQSVTPGYKLSTALLLLTLCLSAAAAAVLVFNTHGQEPGHEDNSLDIRHQLRQISNGANVRAAIHLEGQRNPEIQTSVEWRTQVDQSHAQGGLKLDHNEIVIPQSGLYFVYSQASFRVSCSSSDADDSSPRPLVHLSHTVQRWSSLYSNDDTKKTYSTILHSVRTACQKTNSSDPDQEGSWFSAVYMGAVFNLSQGDRLRTVMEERMLEDLEEEPGKTFFGVFAL